MIQKGFWSPEKPEVKSQTLLKYLGNDSETFEKIEKKLNSAHFDKIVLDSKVCLETLFLFVKTKHILYIQL